MAMLLLVECLVKQSSPLLLRNLFFSHDYMMDMCCFFANGLNLNLAEVSETFVAMD